MVETERLDVQLASVHWNRAGQQILVGLVAGLIFFNRVLSCSALLFLSSNLLLVLTCKSRGVHLEGFLPFLVYFEKKWYWFFTCVVACTRRRALDDPCHTALVLLSATGLQKLCLVVAHSRANCGPDVIPWHGAVEGRRDKKVAGLL